MVASVLMIGVTDYAFETYFFTSLLLASFCLGFLSDESNPSE